MVHGDRTHMPIMYGKNVNLGCYTTLALLTLLCHRTHEPRWMKLNTLQYV